MCPANVETMFYVGETPWHGLGKQVDNALTAEEAIIAAGLDWKVNEQPVFVNNEIQSQWKALVRSDNGLVLNIANKTYKPVQNRDAFKFFDEVTTVGAAKYHTAGSLNHGKTIWMLAKLPGDLVITKEDIVEKYVLLANGHDGFHALVMQWTPIRVVCQNTLNIALAETPTRFYARHTQNIYQKAGAARDILGVANKFYTEFMEQSQAMATTLALPAPDISRLVTNIFGIAEGENPDEAHKLRRNAYQKTMELVETGKGQTPEIRGTDWGIFNAVTEYVDHYMPVRAKREGAQVESLWFGRGAELKREAWDKIKANRAGML